MRRGCVAVTTEGVARLFLDSEELLNDATSADPACKWWKKRLGRQVEALLSLSSQLQHTLERVSGSTSHMAFEAMMGKLLSSCRYKVRPWVSAR